MGKAGEIKRNHHYVWAHYLRAWASGNDIWHLGPSGAVSCNSVKGLSKEEGYNDVVALTHEDVDFLKRWPTHDSTVLKGFHKRQIAYFEVVSALINCHRGRENSSDYEKLCRISREAEANFFEETHTAIELLARPILDQLVLGSVACLDDRQNSTNFCNFLAHQLFRTRKIRDRIFDEHQKVESKSAAEEKYKRLFKKNWWLLSFMNGSGFGYGLVLGWPNSKKVFIRNDTNIPFITNDCPVINLQASADPLNRLSTSESLDLYYPISPKFAYIIADSSNYEHMSLGVCEDEVRQFNIAIANNAHLTIYSNSEKSIREFKPHFRSSWKA